MRQFSIRDKCRINTNCDSDIFVGITCENEDISINFPIGYAISKDDRGLRSDIFLLLNTIKITTGKKNSEIIEGHSIYHDTAFPIQAYMAVIYDFYSRGYYKEHEAMYGIAKRGKVNWNKTIKTQKLYVQGTSVYYLNFVTKRNRVNCDELVTLIHEFFVYESFCKIGWLFTGGMPEKPKIEYNEKLFRSILKEKIANTFNDKNRELFINMLAIIDYQADNHFQKNYRYGTYRFEYVWEAMIDKVYGISEKKEYFPKTYWTIPGKEHANAPLKPDTIMVYKGSVYVLDAKYYKYGVTGKVTDLPQSASIYKQITYGEYITHHEKFKKKYGKDFKVYNAFIMPFNSLHSQWKTKDDVLWIGEAYGDWKRDGKPESESYEHIQGVVIDVKHLMKINTSHNEEEIMKLAEKITRFYEEVQDENNGFKDFKQN